MQKTCFLSENLPLRAERRRASMTGKTSIVLDSHEGHCQDMRPGAGEHDYKREKDEF